MNRLATLVCAFLLPGLAGHAQLPLFPQQWLVYGKVHSITSNTKDKQSAEYDESGHLIGFNNTNVHIRCLWDGNDVKAWYVFAKEAEPSYQYGYLESVDTKGFAFYNGIDRWSYVLDDSGRVISMIHQSPLPGGYIVSQTSSFFYDSAEDLLPSRCVESPGGHEWLYSYKKKDSHGNAVKYSFSCAHCHTENEVDRVITYY